MRIELTTGMPQAIPLHAATIGRGWRWFNHVLAQCALPVRRDKPYWVHLPDRVWKRQSALLVSLHELKRGE
jgi:hypothetical protein